MLEMIDQFSANCDGIPKKETLVDLVRINTSSLGAEKKMRTTAGPAVFGLAHPHLSSCAVESLKALRNQGTGSNSLIT